MSKLSLKTLFLDLPLAILIAWAWPFGLAMAQTDEASSGQVVFEVLASEIALQRGEAGLAYNTYMEMARQYKDPRLAQRAMEIGIAGGSPELALQAAKTWDSLAPKSETKPKEVLVTLLILNNRWQEATKPAIALLRQQTPVQQEATLVQLQTLLSKAKNESEALRAFYEIASNAKLSS